MESCSLAEELVGLLETIVDPVAAAVRDAPVDDEPETGDEKQAVAEAREWWTGAAIDDMAALDKTVARRVKQAVERFAAGRSGSVKELQGLDPPEYRLRVGDWRVRFELDTVTLRVLRVRNRREAYR